MVLPKMNYNTATSKSAGTVKFTTQEEMLVSYLKQNGSITDDEMQSLLDVKKSRAYSIIKSMKEKGIIVTSGRGSDRKHYLK